MFFVGATFGRPFTARLPTARKISIRPTKIAHNLRTKKDGIITSVLDFLAVYCFHDSVDYFREIPAALGSVEKSEVLTVSYSCAVIPPTAWYAILLCGAEIILYTLNSCFCIILVYRAELTDYYRYSLA